MLFNSLTFIMFLALVIFISRAINHWPSRKGFLLFSSYVFYAAWNPLFTLLIVFSTVCDWVFANAIHTSSQPTKRKIFLIGSLIVNLGLLSYFKYGDFFLQNSVALLKTAGINYIPPEFNILLPIGISFYTFQSLSYTIDVYRNELTKTYSFADFSLFVAFFPQLVAGPIVRANEFLPQCETPKKASSNQMGWGLSLIIIGLFCKVILADELFAPLVNAFYNAPEKYGSLDTWTALFSFSWQIFFDFSGYSLCAIGTALCLGFMLPDNFHYPYAALGFSDFWKRWHITLSAWLRDYLYISLGGNRKGTWLTFRNLMITMFLGGLWHGASWLFVLWGLLHGAYLVIEHAIKTLIKPLKLILSPITRIMLMGLTFLIVTLTWIPFRAPSVDVAQSVLQSLFNATAELKLDGTHMALACVATFILFIWQVLMRDHYIETVFTKMPALAKVLVLCTLALCILIFSGGDNRAFIYFQF